MALISCNGTILVDCIGATFVDGSVQTVGTVCLEAGHNGVIVDALHVHVGGHGLCA